MRQITLCTRWWQFFNQIFAINLTGRKRPDIEYGRASGKDGSLERFFGRERSSSDISSASHLRGSYGLSE